MLVIHFFDVGVLVQFHSLDLSDIRFFFVFGSGEELLGVAVLEGLASPSSTEILSTQSSLTVCLMQC